MILDGRGRLVWFHPLPRGTTANDFKLQRYRGEPVLTWWEGRMNARGYGQGEWVIADRSYREIARVRAGNGLKGDLHDMQLTESGTALITIYHVTDADLSAVGGSATGRAVDSIVQEVEVATGAVRFEWHSLGRVALTESRVGVPRQPDIPFDYFHINSIDLDRDGNLLVSARNTWAIYKIDHSTGRVLWRLGGRRSDFSLGQGARFAWQHDARRQRDGTVTLFDNESTPKIGSRSRLLTLRVDHKRHRATVVRALAHPAGILAGAEGNSQQLADGAVFAGWGLGRRVSEHDATGNLTFDLRLPRSYDTYRAFRFDWRGRPTTRPAVAAERDGDRVTVRASWNGATPITHWQLLAGPRADQLRPLATVPRTGFETTMRASTDATYVTARALDGSRTLGAAPALAVR